MGKVQMGILDGFVGKVGTVVGSFWKGKPVMRAYKRRIKDFNSEAQQLVRTRFAQINKLAGMFDPAISIGFFNAAKRRQITEGDYFVKVNWGFVHADTPGAATVDFTELSLSEGNLPEVQFGSPRFDEPLTVDVPISGDVVPPGADSNDLAYLYVYSPEAAAGLLAEPVTRGDESVVMHVPDYWNGHRVHLWGFAVGGGQNDEGKRSPSRYLGSATIG